MRRILFGLLLLAAASPAFAREVKILVPVIADAGQVAHAYLYADDTGAPSRVSADDLRAWARETLDDAHAAAFEKLVGADGTVNLADTGAAGFILSYDDQSAALCLHAEPAALRTRRLALNNAPASPAQTPVKPAKISGFMNLRAGQDYVHDSAAQVPGRAPARLDLDGALNVKNWVIDGRFDYLEDSVRPWQRDDVRLVHDWPDQMVRLAVGDLSYPVSGFQSFTPMLGMSIARNFSLQPYRVTTPTGRTSFMLASPSRVDVMVNGQRVRTLQLQPGNYDVSDFPVADGSNDVSLIITDATGRVEEKRFQLVSDQILLRKGLKEYAYNIGVESENRDRAIEYDFSRPVFSAFHRYGVSDRFTIGAMLQADADVRQAGMTFAHGFSFGTLGFDGAASQSEAGAGAAAQWSYSYSDFTEGRSFTAALEYKSADFAALGQDEAENPTAWDMTARYTQPVFRDLTMGVGGRYQFARAGNDDSWSYSLNFRRMIFGTISASVSFEHRSEEGAGVYAGLTWTPGGSQHVVSSAVDSFTKGKDVNWSWHDTAGQWWAGAGVNETGAQRQATGNVAYTGYRGEISVRDNVVSALEPAAGGSSRWSLSDHRTQITAGTAIAFADDHVALSRPINNGFVMVTRHKSLSGRSIGINPVRDGDRVDYQAQIDALGPAVIHDAVPYMYRAVSIDTRNMPGGYDPGNDSYTVMPSYKSGAVISVGSAANIYADGYIVLPGGAPAGLQAGEIADADGAAQEFFTNTKGRFRISRLKPGTYEMTLYAYPHAPVVFDIPQQAALGRYDAGTLVLPQDAP
jgi:outer membrane usher protein